MCRALRLASHNSESVRNPPGWGALGLRKPQENELALPLHLAGVDQPDNVVFQELWPESQRLFLRVLEDLRDRRAEGIILGCTEIPLLLKPEHCA